MSELDPTIIDWLNQAPHALIILWLVYDWRRVLRMQKRLEHMEQTLENMQSLLDRPVFSRT